MPLTTLMNTGPRINDSSRERSVRVESSSRDEWWTAGHHILSSGVFRQCIKHYLSISHTLISYLVSSYIFYVIQSVIYHCTLGSYTVRTWIRINRNLMDKKHSYESMPYEETTSEVLWLHYKEVVQRQFLVRRVSMCERIWWSKVKGWSIIWAVTTSSRSQSIWHVYT